MKVLDILNSPWAITQGKLEQISDIYQRHLHDERLDVKSIEIAIAGSEQVDPEAYRIVDGVAILSIDGVIAKRMNMFTKISGGVSTQILRDNFEQAMADPNVKAIILSIDSPGGEVDGTQVMAQAIREARGKGKPIYAFADGLMASAAYWIGSAADRVYMSSDTTQVGSIGVVATHVDYSKADEREGIKRTEITAGKYKRIASDTEPLSEEGRESIQEVVDQIYSVFVNDVAKNRGVSVDTVLENMADGRLFMGKAAIEAGLVDGVSSVPELVSVLAARTRSVQQVIPGARADSAAPAIAAGSEGDAVSTRKEAQEVADAAGAVDAVDPPTAGAPAGDGSEHADDAKKLDGGSDDALAHGAPPVSGSGTVVEPSTPPTRGGNENMLLESKVREILKLDSNATEEDVVAALKGAAATRDIVMAGGDGAVALIDHMTLLEQNKELTRKLADKDSEIASILEDGKKKERAAIAESLVREARDAGKVPPSLEKWAKDLAYSEPEKFKTWAAVAHKVVSLNKGDGSSPSEMVAGSAAEQFNAAVDLYRKECKDSGKPDPGLSKAQQIVAKENPGLYEEYSTEMRQIRR